MYWSKQRVVFSGKSVIAVGARCTVVRANEFVVRGCCTVTWNKKCSLPHTRSHVLTLGDQWWVGLTSEYQSHLDVFVQLVGRGLAAIISVCVAYVVVLNTMSWRHIQYITTHRIIPLYDAHDRRSGTDVQYQHRGWYVLFIFNSNNTEHQY